MKDLLSDHPSQEDLLVLAQGRLPEAREREVLLHILQPCETCLGLLGRPRYQWPPLAQESTDALDAAIERAFDTARVHSRHADAQGAEAEKGLQALRRGGLEALPVRLGTLAKVEALLARSWEVRGDDTGLMLQLATLAWHCSRRLDARYYGVRIVSDLQCRALLEVANAYRATDQFRRASDAIYEARLLFEKGTRNDLLEARVLTVEATLHADCRRFREASVSLAKVYRLHRKRRDDHMAGRTLVKLGLYEVYAGNSFRALKFLRESLTLIDARRDPDLALTALHNIVSALLDAGDFREAEKMLFQARPLHPHVTGRLRRLRIRWQEGCVDAGLDRLERAARTFEETRDGFLEANRAFDAALVSLDLAATLLAQGRPGEAESVVGEAIQIFVALRVEREALAALITLRTVCERREATRAMILEVATFIRRFVPDPGMPAG